MDFIEEEAIAQAGLPLTIAEIADTFGVRRLAATIRNPPVIPAPKYKKCWGAPAILNLEI